MRIESAQYAGHSAVLLHGTHQGKGITIAIDPWLKGNPLCPEPLKSPERVNLIVLSHGHADHASDAVRLAQQYDAKIAATFELASLLAREGVPQDRLIFMNKGGSVQIWETTVTLTHAFHSSSFDTSSDGTAYAGEACGVVITAENTTIYHAGDTALFGDLALIARRHRPQIAFLPIGDAFTMGPEDAAEAAKIISPRIAIPIHFGTFPPMTGTPAQFEEECRRRFIRSRTLSPGEEIVVAELL